MRRGLFKRLLLLSAVIIVLAVLFTEVSITGAVRGYYLDNVRKNLSIQAALMADRVPPAARDGDAWCREMKEITGARVTLIAPDGRVIGESDAGSASMENHRMRPEVLQAEREGTGTAIRRSATLKEDCLYVAYRASSGVPGTVIRLCIPLRDVDGAVNVARLNVLLIAGFVIVAMGAFTLWQFERLRRLTNEIRDFAASLLHRRMGKKLFLRDAGEFSEIAGSLNILSDELKTVIDEHEQERKRLNEILRSIPDALLIIDDRGVVLLSSAATRTFFGDTPLLGRPFIQVIRNSEFQSLLDRVRASGTAEFGELRLEHPEERSCVVRISPLFQSNDVLSGFVAIFHDITEIRKLEQVRKDFVANASHEIKTPITAIKGFADTLLEGALEDREHAGKFLTAIKANSERINSLVDDLMTISKIEMGVLRVEKSTVSFSDVAENVRAILGEKAAARGLYLKISPDPGDRKILADRDRLTQILTNLVENGIKFTEQGGVTFGLTEERGRQVVLVEDTGIGVPKQHLPRLGERFYRVDPSRSRNMGGTGLGLAIVKHLVKALGWDMQIESVHGKGTKVRVYVL